MSNVAVIYAANLKPLASQPVFGGLQHWNAAFNGRGQSRNTRAWSF